MDLQKRHQDLPVVSVDLELLGSVHPLQGAKALHTKKKYNEWR